MLRFALMLLLCAGLMQAAPTGIQWSCQIVDPSGAVVYRGGLTDTTCGAPRPLQPLSVSEDYFDSSPFGQIVDGNGGVWDVFSAEINLLFLPGQNFNGLSPVVKIHPFDLVFEVKQKVEGVGYGRFAVQDQDTDYPGGNYPTVQTSYEFPEFELGKEAVVARTRFSSPGVTLMGSDLGVVWRETFIGPLELAPEDPSSQIPEPSSWLLVAAGGGWLVWRRRKHPRPVPPRPSKA